MFRVYYTKVFRRGAHVRGRGCLWRVPECERRTFFFARRAFDLYSPFRMKMMAALFMNSPDRCGICILSSSHMEGPLPSAVLGA